MADFEKEKATAFHDKKYQGGKALPFLDYDFTGHHTTEWYQWEVNVLLLAKGAMQLNSVNGIGRKVKALLIKLYTVHRKDMINIFSDSKRQLEVKIFLKSAKDVKHLLDYSIITEETKRNNDHSCHWSHSIWQI
eukprot:9207424-Ditylum_brightwellii.AAC.2